VLPSLVIGLREGLEAALIVCIIAAFLRANGRLDLLRWVWFGVAAAVALCLGVGVALRVASQNLPARQQEGLETVIAAVAVGMVTYMVVWMRRHAAGIKSELEGAVGSALDTGTSWALVLMAFLAVMREGFETAVFLVAAFNESDNPRASATGALVGVLAACALGYAIYRGGVRIDLARFFRATGVVLVVVAAGLVVAALHSAHEAGWIDVGQQQVLDLRWLVDPGSVRSSLLTGVLGLQPRPVVVELAAWLVFVVPMTAFVLWPAARPVPPRPVAVAGAATAVAAGVAVVVLTIAAPSGAPTAAAALSTTAGELDVTTVDRGADHATFRLSGTAVGDRLDVTAARAGTEEHGGRAAVRFVAASADTPSGGPEEMSLDEVARLNGGRLPLGVSPDSDPGDVSVSRSISREVTVWLDARTGDVLDAEVVESMRSVADLSVGPVPLGEPDAAVVAATDGTLTARGRVAEDHSSQLDLADDLHAWQRLAAFVGIAAAAAGAVTVWSVDRRRRGDDARAPGRGPPSAGPALPIV
jgi:high-affinity iron transporter